MKSDFIFSFKTVDEDEEEIVYSNTEAGSKSSQYFFKTAGDFLIKPSNTVLYQGMVKKKSPWLHYNKRRLILYSNRLEYIDPLTNKKKGDIGLNILCNAIWNDNYTFEVFTPKRVYVFKTENEGSALVWCSRINLVTQYLKKD